MLQKLLGILDVAVSSCERSVHLCMPLFAWRRRTHVHSRPFCNFFVDLTAC